MIIINGIQCDDNGNPLEKVSNQPTITLKQCECGTYCESGKCGECDTKTKSN